MSYLYYSLSFYIVLQEVYHKNKEYIVFFDKNMETEFNMLQFTAKNKSYKIYYLY